MNWLLVISIIIIILGLVGLTIYLLLLNNQTQSDSDQSTPPGPTPPVNPVSPISPISPVNPVPVEPGRPTPIRYIETEENKRILENINLQNVDPKQVTLMRQLGVDPCLKDVSYGFNPDKTGMYVKNKCRGIFLYDNKIGVCSSDGGIKICPFDKLVDGNDGTLMGFSNPTTSLQLIKDLSNGKCGSGDSKKYGIDGYNMYVTDGCQGWFRLGTMTGLCNSRDNAKTLCPIGQTIRRGDVTEGLAVKKLIYQGINGYIRPGLCEFDQTNQTMGFEDENNIYVKDNCGGKFNFGTYYSGQCSPSQNKKICPIGSVNENNQGLPVLNI